jgi:uncharacterized protein (TIGR00730 family)
VERRSVNAPTARAVHVASEQQHGTVQRMEKWEKPRKDSGIKDSIQELIASHGGGYNPEIVEDIIANALKMLKDVRSRGDARVIQTAVRELRYAFRLFDPYAQTRKVTIFGSSRVQPTKAEYLQAVEFARKIADAGFMIITGAGPGIMQAGHEGAGPERSFGANIRLPWEQAANPVILKDKKLITFKYFFTRKLTFIRNSDAIVLFPGGFGTLDEGYEAITLMQTGKGRLMPLVLIDVPGGTYWKTWDKTVREHLLAFEFISPDDLYLYQITDDPDQAVGWITHFYHNYHSSRFVRELYVIRLQRAPSSATIARLNEEFADIVIGPKISAIQATPDERESQDAVDLARIAFGFDRRQYGRLRQLIDVLNDF